MRAVQVTRLDGPEALEIREIPEPTPDGPFGPQVLVDVHAVGISFPDLLLSKGEYQLKPEPPFTLGVDFAGVVRSAPDGSGFATGDRVHLSARGTVEWTGPQRQLRLQVQHGLLVRGGLPLRWREHSPA